MKQHVFSAGLAIVSGLAAVAAAAGFQRVADGRWTETAAESGLVAPLEWEHAGRIADGNGEPVTGAKTLEVRLYGAAEGGDVLWGRQAPVLLDGDGNFSVRLMDALPALEGAPESSLAEVLLAGPAWIECSLAGGPSAMQPRAAVAAAPYALFAGAAAGADPDFAVAASLVVAGETRVSDLAARDATAGGPVTVTGGLSVGGDLSAAGGLKAAALDGVGPVPVGAVILWYGDSRDLPEGWAVCGELAGRFPVGAGRLYHAGDTGGVAKVALAMEQMPPHSHSIVSHSSDDEYKKGHDKNRGIYHGYMDAATEYAGGDSSLGENAGNGMEHENLPPYRALHFIKRVE